MKRKHKIIAVILFLILASLVILDENEVVLVCDKNMQVQYEYQSDFVEPEVRAFYQKKIFSFIRFKLETEKTGDIDTTVLGSQFITYKAEKDEKKAELTLEFIVVDTTAPVITLVENEDYYTEYGQEYIEEGFNCLDNYDGDITDRVIRELKENRVIYTATDSSGNTTVVEREINYVDTTAPVISFDNSYTAIEVGSDLNVGFTAYDAKDGDLTESVIITGEIDNTKMGIYTLTYTVSDSSGNVASIKRDVYVYKRQADPENLNPSKKIVYLTFDDGPSSHTARLLEILDKYNVKVTFFVNGKNSSYFNNVGKAYRKGHSIGNHTYSHNYKKIYSSVSGFYTDLNYNGELIYEQTGVYTKLLRFPGGSSNTVSRSYCKGIMSTLTSSVTSKGYKYFDWNVSSGDTSKMSSTAVYNNVIKGIKKHNVSTVLQHDTKGYSVDAVERIILWGLINGYTFLPLDLSSPAVHHGINN
ncbi:MAG: polysaccharide deacetylase family protein [Erysipelotrichaceae bacterium]|jgi:peptidoglycan/xylan/chitin deacetylase (PgdA/CDA1 family)